MVIAVMSGGFFTTNLPKWALWIKYGSFVTYAYNALIIIDFENTDIE